jgi:ATP-dependent protease HslVU (ClpYQ) peptidase subunit
MTTVVATRDRIVCDSQVTHGQTTYHTSKVESYRGALIGVAGPNEQLGQFLRWYKGGRKPGKTPLITDPEFDVIVLDKNGLHIYTSSFVPDNISDPHYAIGSGSYAALAAMLCGKSAEEAVAIACQIDSNTGPPVQTFLLADVAQPKRSRTTGTANG